MNKYWAAESAETVAGELLSKINEKRITYRQSGLKEIMAKSYRMYYGKHFDTDDMPHQTGIKSVGEEGELKAVTINHYRNVIRHQLNMTTRDKPAWDPRATNTDQSSIQQAKLAGNILDYYMRDKRLGRYFRDAAELALVLSKGLVKIDWDKNEGRTHSVEPVMEESGEPKFSEDGSPKMKEIREGDIKIKTLSPFDHFTDDTVRDFEDREWDLCIEQENKFNLSARHPELEQRILALEDEHTHGIQNSLGFNIIDKGVNIPLYTFSHKRTDAMPNGRLLIFLADKTIIYDDAYPYRRLNVFRIVPGKIFGSVEGYSDAFDIIAPQEAIDVLYSTFFTNQQAFGTQFIHMPEGCNLSATQFRGLAVLKGGVPGTEPKALQLCATPPELFKGIELLEKSIEILSGVNSVVRGDPEANLKSGVALSIVQAQAAQYMSGFQESWAQLNEDCGTFILHLLKDFAKTDRMIAIAGKDNRTLMQSFNGSDLADIDRVVVDLGNPMAKTLAGKLDIADKLLEKGMIQTPTEYLNTMKTGQLEPAIKGYESQIDLVHRENEDLMDGKPCVALATDRHIVHMQEHLIILNDPELRRRADQQDPQAMQIIQVVTDHYMMHKELYQTGDPINAMITGDPPPPPPPMMMPPGAMPPSGMEAGPMPPPDQGPQGPPSGPPPEPMIPQPGAA